MAQGKSQVEAVLVDLSVLLGRSSLPMHQLLRMGRGAVIPLEAAETDEVWVLANEHPIARGEVRLQGDRITVVITREADVHDFYAMG
jgi:flagellar motor switch protein FliN/FliY